MLATPIVFDGMTQRKMARGDVISMGEIINTLTTVGAGTITAALMNSTVLQRSGPTAAFTDTTDTAANIIAGLAQGVGTTGLQNGMTYRMKYQNTVGFLCTLAAGTNVTLAGNTAIPPLSTREFLVSVTNGTPTSVVAATTTNTSAVITGMSAAQTALVSTGQAVSGTGIDAGTTVLSVQPGIGVTLSAAATATGTLVALTFAPRVTVTALDQDANVNEFKYAANTAGTAALAAGDMEGAKSVTLNCSGQAAITKTTRTALEIIAGIPNAQVGMTWEVIVLNRNSDTLTMAGGTDVTITGTATIATVTWKRFICTITSATEVGMQVADSAIL